MRIDPHKAHCASALACAALLAAAGCGGRQGPADAKLASYLSPDANMVAGMRLDQARATPIYKKLEAAGRVPGLEQFSRQTGIDPNRDVTELLVFSDGKETVVAAKGSFANATVPGAKESSYRSARLFVREGGAAAFVDGSVALAGTEAAVKAALDRAGGPGAPDLLKRAEAVAGANQFWAILRGAPPDLPLEGNLANLRRLLQSLETTSITAGLSGGLDLVLHGECRTPEDAKQMNDTVRGLLGLARLATPRSEPELLKLFDGLAVVQREKSVKVTLSVPGELVDKLLQMLPAATPPPAAAGRSRPKTPGVG